jgi:hypothetical protein
MANVKITTLTNLQAPADADRFIIDDISDTETKSVTFANLKAQIDTIAISNTNTVSSNVDAVESRRVANIAGAVSSILTSDLTASRALVSGSGGKVEVSAVTSTELGHLDGVNGAIQTQLNSITTNINTLDANADAIESKRASNAVIQTAIEARRVANIAGAVSSITTADLTVNRALVSGSGGKVEVSAVTSTELAHLDGVSGAIQTQLDAKAALAGATFTGQVNLDDDLVITGNLTVSGDTTISEITAVESRRASNAVIQTAIEARRTANVVIQTAIEARRVANVTEQTAIEARRVANIAGAISSVLTSDLTANKLLTSDSSGKISVSTLAPDDVGASLGNLSNVNTDFGTLDSANLTVDAFTVAIGDLTVFDMLTAPAGEVDAIDLVAFS